ncbi:MAG: winged helix-turn-helix transcriptional regulator [Anaerolineae bacterium]|nr:winged helix-turn-helix transcriptional regulator [Anaerolineae bacterium]
MNESEYAATFESIVNDPTLTEMEKLVRTFHLTTRQYIGHYKHDAEIARAMGDKDTAVREEMKAGMMEPRGACLDIVTYASLANGGTGGMSRPSYETNLEERAQLFKALGHPARLLIINLIQARPRHTEELAAILNLQPATISHHLAQLTAVGLLTSEKEQYYQMYSLVGLALQRSLADLVAMSEPGLATAVTPDAYRDKVLATFSGRPVCVAFPPNKRNGR